MGFYGNITNTAKTNFVFDKIYPNRTEMEKECSKDGVFIGRYVLVDYNEGFIDVLGYTQLYKHKTYDWFYTESSLNWSYRAKYKNLPYYIRDDENNYIINPEKDNSENIGYIFQDEVIYIIEDNRYIFYKCIGEEDSINHFAKFEKLEDNSQLIDSYYQNYINDRNTYGDQIGRGWDSTAWQKVYVDNKEKYVMVAELNSVVPTFGITVDSPTVKPIAPHFDADSTNTYYKLHLQPSWGFRVKQAENAEQSDTRINFSEYYWDNASESASITTHDYDGAIYFNQDGFDVNKHSDKEYDPKVDDYITVLPTGSSGYPYNDHGKSYSINSKDIQELEISLPGIGHAVSTMWDLIYGTGEGQASVRERNQEIGWDNVAGLRLVKTKSDGNGFEYDTEGVNTLAGCINSVHDLMGMIIVDNTENIELKDALTNRIYYKPDTGKYYIKNLVDKLIPVEDSDYTGLIEKMQDFGKNLYYFNNGNYYLENKYQHGNNYYCLEEGPDKQINQISLYEKPWEYGKYYYEKDGDFILTSADTENLKHPDNSIYYYSIGDVTTTTTKIDHKLGENGRCFYPYYNGEINQNYIDTLFPTSKIVEGKTLKCGLFRSIEVDGKDGYMLVDFTTDKYENKPYYYWIGYKIEDSTTTQGQIFETYDFNNATRIIVNMAEFNPNTYYYKNTEGNWKNLNSIADINNNNIYYVFTDNDIKPIKIERPFYKPELYYYKDNKDYILAKENNRIKEPEEYYTIKNIQEIEKEIIFYEPNKYYYKNEKGEYILDTSDTMRNGVEYYYNIMDKYVIEDTNNIFSKGQKWNDFVKIPEDNSVSLGYRKDSYEWKELEGFARTLNTIHGLILSINNLIKFDDTTTRDNKTVQGCINQMNDIINTIDKLKPNHFIAVDEYGRMTSMLSETDDWINVQVNDQKTNLNNKNKIIITHKYPHAEIIDTTSTSNMNENENGSKQDTIELETLEYDDTGHVKKINTETVTLPFGYKTFQDSEETPGETVAENTQDVLILKGDKWIKPTISQGKIEYSHIGPIESKEIKADDADKTPKFGETFEIEDWYFDDKGHKSNRLTHTVKIPQGKLVDTDKNGSDVIIQLEFTPPTGEIKTIREDIANLKLNSYTKSEDNNDVIDTDTLGQALSKLQTQMHDEENVRASTIQSTTTDLNKKISDEIEARKTAIFQEVTDRNAAIKVEADARIKAINDLDATITTEDAEVITSITQTDGLVTAGKKKIGELNLTGWTLGENVANNESIADTDTVNKAFAKAQRQINANKNALAILNGDSEKQGSIAYQITNAIDGALNQDGSALYATAASVGELKATVNDNTGNITAINNKLTDARLEKWDTAEANVQSDWTETDETADSYIKNKPTLNFVPMETYNTLLERIAELEARIEALENPVVEEPMPNPEIPEEPVE